MFALTVAMPGAELADTFTRHDDKAHYSATRRIAEPHRGASDRRDVACGVTGAFHVKHGPSP